MPKAKELHKFTQDLQALYVEDDDKLREETRALFEPLFRHVETARDGIEGLEKYNNDLYDLIITDINMPRMNGIEMVKHIRNINPEQKIVAISAHNEPDILISLIKAGVNSFILKPIIQQEVIDALYPVCRDAYIQNMNIELIEQLNEDRAKLEQQNKELRAQAHTIGAKHWQIGMLMQQQTHDETQQDESQQSPTQTPIVQEYFSKDEDEGEENVVLLSDHCADLLEIFNEIPELISCYAMDSNPNDITTIIDYLTKTASILFHYTPYLDSLSHSMNDLATAITDNREPFEELLKHNPDALTVLFDAVSSDMDRYVEKFKTESLAMKNTHHLHKPTALSIQQIIAIISPSEIEFGDFEFF